MGPWPEREKERVHLRALHPSTNAIPCTSLRNLEPSRNRAMMTPDPAPPLGKEDSRKPGWGQASQWLIPRDPSPGEFPISTQHCLRTTVASSRSPEHVGDPRLHPSPEGHHREQAITVRAEGAGLGGGTGQRPSCPQGGVAGSQGKVFALAANGAWVPGSLGGGGILFLEPPPLMPEPPPPSLASTPGHQLS